MGTVNYTPLKAIPAKLAGHLTQQLVCVLIFRIKSSGFLGIFPFAVLTLPVEVWDGYRKETGLGAPSSHCSLEFHSSW